MPPIVISRHAIDATTAPPKASPRRPGRKKKVDAVNGQGGQSRRPHIEEVNSSTKQSTDLPTAVGFKPRSSSLLPVGDSVNQHRADDRTCSGRTTPPSHADVSSNVANEELRKTELWQYLMVYLPPATPLPDDFFVAELLPLGRQRDLPHRWKFQLAGGHPTTKTLCAVLVYLTGVPRSSPCETCANPGDTEATEEKAAATILPFPGCVGLPAVASFRLKEYFGASVCCNLFYQSGGTKRRTHCVSRFSLPSSDLGGTRSSSVAESVVGEKVESYQLQSPEKSPSDDGDDHDNDGGGSGSDTSIAFSPATARSSPGYKTALPARMAGRPKVVSIRKASRTVPAAKAKRQSSIRRLAAKLGAKAARREVAVYKPSEAAVVEEEDQEDERPSQTTETEGSNGTRRSRRLLEQQREQPRPESKQSANSKASSTGSSGSPSKPSKLRKKENKGSSASPASSSKTSRGASDGSLQEKLDAEPPQSLMMADWEIAPGRIRVGTGEDAESEYSPYTFTSKTEV
jgi:hypothetical protein